MAVAPRAADVVGSVAISSRRTSARRHWQQRQHGVADAGQPPVRARPQRGSLRDCRSAGRAHPGTCAHADLLVRQQQQAERFGRAQLRLVLRPGSRWPTSRAACQERLGRRPPASPLPSLAAAGTPSEGRRAPNERNPVRWYSAAGAFTAVAGQEALSAIYAVACLLLRGRQPEVELQGMNFAVTA